MIKLPYQTRGYFHVFKPHTNEKCSIMTFKVHVICNGKFNFLLAGCPHTCLVEGPISQRLSKKLNVTCLLGKQVDFF